MSKKIIDYGDIACLSRMENDDELTKYLEISPDDQHGKRKVGAYEVIMATANSPLASQMLGAHVGGTMLFGGKEFWIKDVYTEIDLHRKTVEFFTEMGMETEASEYARDNGIILGKPPVKTKKRTHNRLHH